MLPNVNNITLSFLGIIFEKGLLEYYIETFTMYIFAYIKYSRSTVCNDNDNAYIIMRYNVVC